MNRPIKFRAWDTTDKCMLDSQINGRANLHVNGYGEMIWQFGFDFNTVPQDRYRLMQFTGLTDKNGVEIYEGDIYKSRLNTKFPYTLQVVRWDDLNQGFLPKMNYPEDSMGRSHHGEVIGNVWENPELLTKQP